MRKTRIYTVGNGLGFDLRVDDQEGERYLDPEFLNLLRSGRVDEFNQVRPEEEFSLSRVNLDGTKLAGIDLSHVRLSEASFGGSDLRGANLSYAGLDWVNFTGTSLIGVNFQEASLMLTHLYRADLTGADFHRAHLDRAKFWDCKLDNINWGERRGRFDNVDCCPTEPIPIPRSREQLPWCYR